MGKSITGQKQRTLKELWSTGEELTWVLWSMALQPPWRSAEGSRAARSCLLQQRRCTWAPRRLLTKSVTKHLYTVTARTGGPWNAVQGVHQGVQHRGDWDGSWYGVTLGNKDKGRVRRTAENPYDASDRGIQWQMKFGAQTHVKWLTDKTNPNFTHKIMSFHLTPGWNHHYRVESWGHDS